MVTTRERRALKWVLAALAVVLIFLLGSVVTVGVAARQFQYSDRIAANVSIAGVQVGGMTGAEAQAAVSAALDRKPLPDVTVRWDETSESISPRELGLRFDVEAAVASALRVGREGGLIGRIVAQARAERSGVSIPVTPTVDETQVRRVLQDLARRVNRPPVNARIRVDGEQVSVVPGRDGLKLDERASAEAIIRVLKSDTHPQVDLVVRPQPPPIQARDLQHIQVVLASYTTRFRPWQKDRTHNLRLAIEKLSETVVMPGETLSFNRRVGPRLEERGFREAPIFVNGEIEPSTGGGVCQVATTVYNAALLAGLDILERHHHSRPVDYAPSGRDATVFWGQADLRVRNNLAHPILFIGSIGSNTITIKVLGSKEDKRDVEIIRSGVSTLSFTTQEVKDPELEEGKRKVEKPGRNGERVTVTRIIRKDGRVLKQETLHTDIYRPQAQVVRVGTKPPAELPPGATGPSGPLTPEDLVTRPAPGGKARGPRESDPEPEAVGVFDY